MFDPQIEFPEPLISREMTFGVAERVLATGEVIKPIDAQQIEAIVDDLKRKGVVSVAVSLLNAYLNPANERAIRDDHPKARARPVRLDLVRRRAADPRVSAHLDGGDERLHGADHRALSRRVARRAEAARLRRTIR